MTQIDTTKFYKFRIEQRKDLSFYLDMRDWLNKNCTKHWQWYAATDSIVFWDEQDAVAFKLTFGL